MLRRAKRSEGEIERETHVSIDSCCSFNSSLIWSISAPESNNVCSSGDARLAPSSSPETEVARTRADKACKINGGGDGSVVVVCAVFFLGDGG